MVVAGHTTGKQLKILVLFINKLGCRALERVAKIKGEHDFSSRGWYNIEEAS
ncbi:hypothetical protein GCM10010918_29860 [Paenibacillus radicis (ex Gao et al. 2016)]|uniref:Uncharacterized protein n=1 Tax=Paenibacillus radicis (ex Gao et al. 2016) TaxID=1737354 RepID=A0A917H9Q3_9BACL|nr:hypothetical protein GCM10010918_29860 [Paenibacillus radicis (ex Gao et al. 2016)]